MLLETMTDTTVNINPYGESALYIEFISILEGFKTRCKNLHWSAPRKNIHVYLDKFLDIISDYQDALAEDYMGILGKMPSTCINGIAPMASDPWGFIKEVKDKTIKFYDSLPEGVVYVGIRSETETFIHNINKYDYLFSLCKNHTVD